MKILVFDTETTGLPEARNTSILETEKWPYIVQISWILYDSDVNEVMSIVDYIIKCEIEIPEDSIKIHGISNERAQLHGVSIEKAMNQFDSDLVKSDIVLGHNISFDKRVYMVEAIRRRRRQYFTVSGVRKPEYCTMKKLKNYCNIRKTGKNGKTYIKYPTLTELHEKAFGVVPKNAHDSMVDVLICLRCYMSLAHENDIVESNDKIKNIFKLYNIVN